MKPFNIVPFFKKHVLKNQVNALVQENLQLGYVKKEIHVNSMIMDLAILISPVVIMSIVLIIFNWSVPAWCLPTIMIVFGGIPLCFVNFGHFKSWSNVEKIYAIQNLLKAVAVALSFPLAEFIVSELANSYTLEPTLQKYLNILFTCLFAVCISIISTGKVDALIDQAYNKD